MLDITPQAPLASKKASSIFYRIISGINILQGMQNGNLTHKRMTDHLFGELIKDGRIEEKEAKKIVSDELSKLVREKYIIKRDRKYTLTEIGRLASEKNQFIEKLGKELVITTNDFELLVLYSAKKIKKKDNEGWVDARAIADDLHAIFKRRIFKESLLKCIENFIFIEESRLEKKLSGGFYKVNISKCGIDFIDANKDYLIELLKQLGTSEWEVFVGIEGEVGVDQPLKENSLSAMDGIGCDFSEEAALWSGAVFNSDVIAIDGFQRLDEERAIEDLDNIDKLILHALNGESQGWFFGKKLLNVISGKLDGIVNFSTLKIEITPRIKDKKLLHRCAYIDIRKGNKQKSIKITDFGVTKIACYSEKIAEIINDCKEYFKNLTMSDAQLDAMDIKILLAINALANDGASRTVGSVAQVMHEKFGEKRGDVALKKIINEKTSDISSLVRGGYVIVTREQNKSHKKMFMLSQKAKLEIAEREKNNDNSGQVVTESSVITNFINKKRKRNDKNNAGFESELDGQKIERNTAENVQSFGFGPEDIGQSANIDVNQFLNSDYLSAADIEYEPPMVDMSMSVPAAPSDYMLGQLEQVSVPDYEAQEKQVEYGNGLMVPNNENADLLDFSQNLSSLWPQSFSFDSGLVDEFNLNSNLLEAGEGQDGPIQAVEENLNLTKPQNDSVRSKGVEYGLREKRVLEFGIKVLLAVANCTATPVREKNIVEFIEKNFKGEKNLKRKINRYAVNGSFLIDEDYLRINCKSNHEKELEITPKGRQFLAKSLQTFKNFQTNNVHNGLASGPSIEGAPLEEAVDLIIKAEGNVSLSEIEKNILLAVYDISKKKKNIEVKEIIQYMKKELKYKTSADSLKRLINLSTSKDSRLCQEKYLNVACGADFSRKKILDITGKGLTYLKSKEIIQEVTESGEATMVNVCGSGYVDMVTLLGKGKQVSQISSEQKNNDLGMKDVVQFVGAPFWEDRTEESCSPADLKEEGESFFEDHVP